MRSIKQAPLKTNSLTVTANKVDGAVASNAIAVSVGKKIRTEEKERKRKKKKIKMQQTTRRDLNCNVLLPKLIN